MGEKIEIRSDGKRVVPDRPIIPYIEGDGVGPDIWKASARVFNAAIEKCYGGTRKVEWLEIHLESSLSVRFAPNVLFEWPFNMPLPMGKRVSPWFTKGIL